MKKYQKILITVCVIILAVLAGLHMYYGYVEKKVLDAQSIDSMPEYYELEAPEQGRMECISYKSEFRGEQVTRDAMVYLPYGYDETEGKYEVMYLMHGRGGSYKTWMGTPRKERPFKNVLDNMIAAGDINPIIVVTPGLVYDYGEDDDVMNGTADEITRYLLPEIDKQYRTYGDRDHRGMAGFSMGGSLTWHMLRDHTDCFRYYIPMSMALYYDHRGYSELKSYRSALSIIRGIKRSGYSSDDFRVYTATGYDDHKALAACMQVADLVFSDPVFKYTEDDFNKGNIMFKLWPYRWHRYTQSFPYIYDGMKHFY